MAGGYAWAVCAILTLCLWFSYMDRSVMSIVIQPIQAELRFSDTVNGLLQGSAFTVFYSLFGIPVSRVADSWNRRNLICIGVMIWCVATCACGFAAGPWTLFAGRVAVSIGEATLMPSAVSIIADYFGQNRRLRALNVYSLGVFLGSGTALWAGGAILKAIGPAGIEISVLGHLSAWRVVFLTLGASGIVLLPLLALVREPVRREETGADAGVRLTAREVMAALGERRAAAAATIIGFSLTSMAGQALQAWLPTLFIRLHGASPASIGKLIGIATLIGGPLGALTGVILGEWLARRGVIAGRLVVGIVSAIGCVVGVLLATMASERTAWLGVALTPYMIAFSFGTVTTAVADLMPNRLRGLGVSLYLMCNGLLSALLGPLAVGFLTDHMFHDPLAVGTSIRLVCGLSFAGAAAVLGLGVRPYATALLRLRATSA